jgi:hypothetical protein
MTVSILDLHCLNAVCDDYENVESITAEVRRSSHGNVSDAEIAECLSELAAAGLVHVFRFDPHSGRYEPVPFPKVAAEGLRQFWFLITPKGHEELDANWVED